MNVYMMVKVEKKGLPRRNWQAWMAGLGRSTGTVSIHHQGHRSMIENMVGETVSAKLSRKNIRLMVMRPIDSGQMKNLEKDLRQVPDLRILLVRGSADGDVEIVVSVRKPLPLIFL